MNILFSKSITEELAKRVKEYRVAYPMTQQELADKADISVRSVKKFESGQGFS